MDITAGQLRDRVTILKPTYTQNARGEAVASYADGATVWAAVRAASGREVLAAAQVGQVVTIRCKVRWGIDITTEDRIRYRGEVYEVVEAVDPDGRRTELLLSFQGPVRDD